MESRQERATESRVERETLDDPSLTSALQALCHVTSASRGPHARIQSLRNSVGGPITMTTTCSRLLSSLSLSRPCLRLVASAVQSHLSTHRDGGLLTLALCVRLILNAVRLENVSKLCAREVYAAFLPKIVEYLSAKNCPIIVEADSSNLKLMLGYVRNVISAKPVCGLRPASSNHVARLVLKAFLTSVPDTPTPGSFHSDRVLVLQQDKSDVTSSELVDGLLLEWPEKCAQFGPQDLIILSDASQKIRVAVVNVSMSGDAPEEILTNRVETEHSVVQSAVDLMVAKMIKFCDWLMENGVGLLLCQKVVHPKVKVVLRRRGVLYVERLGLQPMAYIQDLTGATAINSVIVRPAYDVWGTIDKVEHCVLHGKSYLHLTKAHNCVCTLLLCAPLEQQLAELKSVVQSAMAGLWSTVRHPYLMCGGGCWQLHLAKYLTHLARTKCDQLCSELSLYPSQLLTCVGALTSALVSTATPLLGDSLVTWVDNERWHFWPAPSGVDLTTEKSPFSCACGLLSGQDVERNSFQMLDKHDFQRLQRVDDSGGGGDDNIAGERLRVGEGVNYDWLVLDTMDCGVSAVQTAVVTACAVLSFTQFIHDVN